MASKKNSIYAHFPKDRNCEVCKRIKTTRALCRRRIGDDHKVHDESGEISTQPPIFSRGTRCSHSMSTLSVQNRKFSGDGKDLKKVFSICQQSRQSFALTIIGRWQNLVKTCVADREREKNFVSQKLCGKSFGRITRFGQFRG